ncbi:MAG: M18 family aminopeptidase [Magnetococcales bacterium]|nr:M18 family aminopeptidase [Magnetococcales bacterium]
MDDPISFINASPTPFHAVREARAHLTSQGFQPLREEDAWTLQPGGRYLVTRNDTSLAAFTLPVHSAQPPPLLLAAAHTDSPALKVKPNPLKRKKDHLLLDLAVYGSAILATWFDRDLSLAGRIDYLDSAQRLTHQLIDLTEPVTRIPNLAIHLNRTANDDTKINPHEELSAPWLSIPCETGETDPARPFLERLEQEIARQDPHAMPIRILGWDLSLYDTQPATVAGVNRQWIVGARLDNLLSVTAILAALGRHDPTTPPGIAMAALFDHEEVGSLSMAGATSNFLASLLGRIYPDPVTLARAMPNSLLLSIDNAHGYHPNYPAKQDDNHTPQLNAGIVIKQHANQRYATSGATAARVKALALRAALPLQEFTVRADMACGSTVGPTVAAQLGIPTVDLGLPTWAMHSLRETAGTTDWDHLVRLLAVFFTNGHEGRR